MIRLTRRRWGRVSVARRGRPGSNPGAGSNFLERIDGFMNFYQYQLAAERTAKQIPKEQRYVNFAMGLAGETGEVVDYLKKVCFHGHPLDKNKLAEELGDLLWYIATIANTADLYLDRIADRNIEKLKKRYPEGFSEERSRERAY
nr:nucleoside triphosphate pyrophosphohydrolase family protein [Moorella sp. E306M]